MRTRAERRAERDRMVAKAKHILAFRWRKKQHPGKYADNLAKCSCAGCGNPRRYNPKEPLTVQEQRMMCEPLYI